jgi:hypothetical protein
MSVINEIGDIRHEETNDENSGMNNIDNGASVTSAPAQRRRAARFSGTRAWQRCWLMLARACLAAYRAAAIWRCRLLRLRRILPLASPLLRGSASSAARWQYQYSIAWQRSGILALA